MRSEFRESLAQVNQQIAFREAHAEVEIVLSRHLEELVSEGVANGILYGACWQT